MVPESLQDWRKGGVLIGAVLIAVYVSNRSSHTLRNSPVPKSIPPTTVLQLKKAAYSRHRLATVAHAKFERAYWQKYAFRLEGRVMQDGKAIPDQRVHVIWRTDRRQVFVSPLTDSEGRFFVDAGFSGRINSAFDWEAFIDAPNAAAAAAAGRRILTRDDRSAAIPIGHLRLPPH